MEYLKEISTGNIVSSNVFGRTFRTSNYRKCTDEEILQFNKDAAIDKVKKQANSRIVSVYPISEQLNLLLEDSNSPKVKKCKDHINNVRTKSDIIKQSLNSKNLSDLKKFNPNDDSLWNGY